ncbi:MAG: energy-coupling factor transporter transmembrane protein EcfT [Oscillospiraceae bacterium]|nr:energy-coupling factor transporter transmembrane protein EcfT [Oscillospiraceae bacterium]
MNPNQDERDSAPSSNLNQNEKDSAPSMNPNQDERQVAASIKTSKSDRDVAPSIKSKRPDPRCAFAIAAYLSLFAVFTRSIIIIGALLAVALLSVAYLRVALPKVFHKLKRLWQVILFVALLQSVFSPIGEVWLKISSFPLLTSGGAHVGLLVLGRLSILILSGALFTAYSARELISGMIRLRLPYEIAYMISVGIRFIPLMGEELRDNLNAIALRGVVIKDLTLRLRLRTYVYLLLPSVAGSLHNAKELAMSMEMRGFRAYPRRTSYFTLILGARDYVLLASVAVLSLLTFGAILRFPFPA